MHNGPILDLPESTIYIFLVFVFVNLLVTILARDLSSDH